MTQTLALKDRLSKDAVAYIGQSLATVMTDFASDNFVNEACIGLIDLELKQRVDHLIEVLSHHLPTDFNVAAPILIALKDTWITPSEKDERSGWANYAAWPIIDYVAKHGLEHPQIALNVLEHLTPLFTAEFAIRSFIDHHFELTYAILLTWCQHDDHHVRRLASEGLRPRLPWAKKLQLKGHEPDAIFPVLQQLIDDPSLYVRKSVANNLNDISKDHPDKVIRWCEQWMKCPTPRRIWIVRRGLRTLIKVGHPAVFKLLGYSQSLQIELHEFELVPCLITLGQSITLTVSLSSQSKKDQRLMIDYKLHYTRANGQLTSKLFKWTDCVLHSYADLHRLKKHKMTPTANRRYFPGNYSIELLINGISYKQCDFNLVV